VRIRRKEQTFCIFCQPDHHGPDHLKEEVYRALSGFEPEPVEVSDMKLMDTTGKEVTDLSKLNNEQELHVVFRISDDQFEPVDVRNVDMTE
jgi:hypothetical protein